MFILCLTVEIKTTCTPHYYPKHKYYMALYAGEGATNHLFCKSNFVSANSHTLWMALTPVDLTHQSNTSRTISSAWVTQIQKNWPLTHNEWWKFHSISTKIIIPKRCRIMTLCPNKIKTCWDFCLSDSLGIAHRSSKHLWTFSAMFWCQHKSFVVDWTFLETPVTVKMKISCLWHRKHWQVPIC